MFTRILFCFSCLIAMVCLGACEGKAPHASDHADDHAPAHATPSSHEDWCGEHQVAESMCTRCNPSLIPGFKATKDWCEEHQMPESQCLACDPDLVITRPAKRGVE